LSACSDLDTAQSPANSSKFWIWLAAENGKGSPNTMLTKMATTLWECQPQIKTTLGNFIEGAPSR